MTPLQFLAEVLPSPGDGYYCIFTAHRKQHAFAKSLKELEDTINKWDAAGHDTYFALAQFEEEGSREAHNAIAMRSFFVDLDGYETKKAAVEELHEFLKRTDLDVFGAPWIVDSGGGIHAYWPLHEDVDVRTWKITAENLKRLCKQGGLKIDNTVTADCARVLRIPGTHNYKKKYGTPRQVKLKLEGGLFEFAEFAAHIKSRLAGDYAAPSPLTMNIPGKRPNVTPGAAQIKLVENSVTSFEPIYEKAISGGGCRQLKEYVERADEDGMEPIWRGLLSWTKVCDDGEMYGKLLSALHPYSDERRVIKLSEIKGPYPCIKMDSENPGVCGKCPHFGKITNPLVLGKSVRTETEAKEITIPVEVGGDEEPVVAKLVQRPNAPRGFSYGKNGGIYKKLLMSKKDSPDGEEVLIDVAVLPYELFVIDMLHQDGDYMCHMVALRPEGMKDVVLPVRAVVSLEETVKFLANQNILATVGPRTPQREADKHLHDYVRACIEEASLTRRAIAVPTQFGWQDDDSFVYSGHVYKPNGAVLKVPMPGLENINSATGTHGTLEDWRKPWQMLIERRMWDMLALCLDSFGSPLMRFSPVASGFLWHIWSTGSGTGKSLALSLKEGVWGQPAMYRTNKSTSPVALQQRMGLLNSLPLLMDEITSKSRNDMEWAPAFIFELAEGKGKDRMEASANKERLNTSTWKLTVTTTSNHSLVDYMSGARKHSSNGELLRMLEWNPKEELRWTPEEKDVLPLVNNNYGVAGEAWVRWLVTNRATVISVYNEAHKRLKTLLEFNDAERYWHAECTNIIAASILLSGKYAGIINTPTKLIISWLKECVSRHRGSFDRTQRGGDDILNAYTREYYGKFIIVRKSIDPGLFGRMEAKFGDGSAAADITSSRFAVCGRIEHETLRDGFVEYYIEEQLLRSHCVSMSYGYDDFREQLKKRYRVVFTKKNLLANTGGPKLSVNVMHISMPISDIGAPEKTDDDEDSLSVGAA